MKLQTVFIKENYTIYNNDKQLFTDKYSRIEEEALRMLNLTIKYKISGEKNILVKVINYLEKIKKSDLVVTRKYIDYLSEN